MSNKMRLKKGKREVFIHHWMADLKIKPWPNTHERVLIPTIPSDNTDKPFHVQIVRKDNLEEIK